MSFSKITYWKNRKKNKRGQGEYPITSKSTDRHFGSNRKTYRFKVRQTNKAGRPYTMTNVTHIRKKPEWVLEKDPYITNKLQNKIRADRRQLKWEEEQKRKQELKTNGKI